MEAGGIQRAGDARRSVAGGEKAQVRHLPRLDPAPDERATEHALPHGGEKYFGASGSVYTLTRKGYAQACPNVARLLDNLSFTQDMENSIMAEVVNRKISNAEAAKAWIKANPAVLDQWLDGVKTLDGKDALPAVQARL